jgi:pimeloyl-ACP methyl ester carboxylesterase
MVDYAAAVVAAARELPAPAVLCGWSMGGLAVLMAAAEARPQRVVLLEPSAPAEVQGVHDVPPAEGVFDPEAEYGPFPPGQRARPESLTARAERKRGVSLPALPCPSVVVYGDEFRELRGHGIAALYGSDELDFPGLDHWDLVLDPRVRHAVAARLA